MSSKSLTRFFKFSIFIRSWLPLSCFILSSLSANFEDRLKNAPNKSEESSLKNIDFIYMINLDQRPEKFAMSLNQLLPFGINPYRFSAVNGWELSLDDINDVGVKFVPGMQEGMWGTSYVMQDEQAISEHEIMHPCGKTYFVHCFGRGTIGIALSHLSCIKDAYDSGYKLAWIMEDDIDVKGDPRDLPRLIKNLDHLVGRKNWDILFTNIDFVNGEGLHVPCSSYAQRPDFKPQNPEKAAIRKVVSSQFSRIGSRYGMESYIITRQGMKKILNFYRAYNIFLPCDMDFMLVPKIKLYCLNEDLISQLPKAISDNGSPPPDRHPLNHQ